MLVDANAAFLPVRVGFPLEEEVERESPGARIAVPTSVVRELDRLCARGTPRAEAARAFVERLPTVAAPGIGDDTILRAAVRTGAWVVTADRALRDRLLEAGVDVLAPRDRHRLERYRPRVRRRATPSRPPSAGSRGGNG